MGGMGLVNVSNHPARSWGAAQRQAAEDLFGPVTELGFPAVPTSATADEVLALAESVAEQVDAAVPSGAVFVAGEHRLTVALVVRLQRAGRRCVTTASERDAQEVLKPDGTVEKAARFRFAGWVDYPKVAP